MSFALWYEWCEGKVWVTCPRCNQDIGSMTPAILSQAMIRTAGRGGVICPDCRAKACKICGAELVDRDAGLDKICWMCFETESTVLVLREGNRGGVLLV